MDPTLVEIHVLDHLSLLPRAKDDAKRRGLGGLALVAIEPTKIQLQLSRVRRLEVSALELDGDKAAHPPMKEQQVDVCSARQN